MLICLHGDEYDYKFWIHENVEDEMNIWWMMISAWAGCTILNKIKDRQQTCWRASITLTRIGLICGSQHVVGDED